MSEEGVRRIAKKGRMREGEKRSSKKEQHTHT